MLTHNGFANVIFKWNTYLKILFILIFKMVNVNRYSLPKRKLFVGPQ